MSGDAGGFEFLDHTGDIGFRARAATLPALFDAATRALFAVILDVDAVEPREAIAIMVAESADEADLLVRYLSELLFLHDARGWVFRGARNVVLRGTGVEAEALGESFDPVRHAITRQVKAVTYHRARVARDEGGWVAELVLDL